MSVYVNADDILKCVVSARQNPQFNDSPQKDSALLAVQEFIQQAIGHPLMTDSFTMQYEEGRKELQVALERIRRNAEIKREIMEEAGDADA